MRIIAVTPQKNYLEFDLIMVVTFMIGNTETKLLTERLG